MTDVQGKIFFKEEQQFRTSWLWLIILISVISSVGLILGVALTEKGKMEEGLIVAAIIIPLEGTMLLLFYLARLETVVSSEGLYFRWWPFQRTHRLLPAKEIEKVEIKKGPSFQYGYHKIPGYGKVHNTGPGTGVHMTLRDGKQVFFGSRTPSSFQTAIERIMTQNV